MCKYHILTAGFNSHLGYYKVMLFQIIPDASIFQQPSWVQIFTILKWLSLLAKCLLRVTEME